MESNTIKLPIYAKQTTDITDWYCKIYLKNGYFFEDYVGCCCIYDEWMKPELENPILGSPMVQYKECDIDLVMQNYDCFITKDQYNNAIDSGMWAAVK